MSIKEYAKLAIRDFFIITTFVNIAMFVLGSIYRSEATFSYEVLLQPPLYGVFGTIPMWILYSKKELTVRQLIVRKIFQVITLEIMLILLTFQGQNLCADNLDEIISFAMSVFIIYVLVNVISWVLDKKSADDMMHELSEYQKNRQLRP